MLTAQLMKSMDAEHLIASTRAEQDALTSTPLELELLDEYEVSTDDMKAVIESHQATLKDQAALLSLLNDQDIHEPDHLKELLEFAAKFRTLASDAGDLFTRMNDLVSTNQE